MSQDFVRAVFMRGGSSKGVFFHAADLPADRAVLDPMLLAVLGSPDPYGRQINGMGGGISSLSKAVLIGPPTHPEADVDYTFAQVAVDRPEVDWSANCGNLSSAVGPFAVDEGLVRVEDGPEALVRIHQVNTQRIIHARFPVQGGRAVTQGDYAIAGVSGTGARVRLDFLNPGGTRGRGLLPSGAALDIIEVEGAPPVRASLVDAKDISATAFKVVTERNIVYLMGRVSQREANRATDIARGVSGVSKVVRVFEIVSEEELRRIAPQPAPVTTDAKPAGG